MKYVSNSVNNGDAVIKTYYVAEIAEVMQLCNIKFKKGNIPKIHDKLHDDLKAKGWSPEVFIDPSSRISITSVKEKIGLCIQTGNIGRMYADLLKLQAMYLKQIIIGAIYILPEKDAAKLMGDNLVNYERFVRELKIFTDVITVPIIILGFHN